MSWAELLLWPCVLLTVQRYTPWSPRLTLWIIRDRSPPLSELLLLSVSPRPWPLWSHAMQVKGCPSKEQLNVAISPLLTWTSVISRSSLGEAGRSSDVKLWTSTLLQEDKIVVDMEENSDTISTLWELSDWTCSLWMTTVSHSELAKACAFSSGQQERVEGLGQHIIGDFFRLLHQSLAGCGLWCFERRFEPWSVIGSEAWVLISDRVAQWLVSMQALTGQHLWIISVLECTEPEN